MSLKIQLEEIKAQLPEHNKVSQEKEFEIIPLKEEMNKITCTNLKFKRNSSTLYDILSYQISPLVNTGLGYDKEETTEDFKLPEKKTEDKPRSYAEILKSLKHGEESKKEHTKTQQERSNHHDLPRRTMSQRRPLVSRYGFNGYFFSYSKFGHKAMDCRLHGRRSVGSSNISVRCWK